MYNKSHKIYLSGPFGIFCRYITLTISYLWARTIETSSLPTDSLRPLFKQIKSFSGILTVYFNRKYIRTSYYECLLGISPSGRNPAGEIFQIIMIKKNHTLWLLRITLNNNYYLFKIFPQFWLAKSKRRIHHNQLLITKFGRIFCLAMKWRQKCSPL